MTPPRGNLQVVTSRQRGFHADVLAQTLRVAGQGTPVLVVQFLQGGIGQGVAQPRRLGQHLDWMRASLSRHVDRDTQLSEAETSAIVELWEFVKEAIARQDYKLIVLDDLDLAMQLVAIPESEILEAITSRPPQISLVLTGATIPQAIVDIADLVTQRRS